MEPKKPIQVLAEERGSPVLIQAPTEVKPGLCRIDIDEVAFLKFRLSKMAEKIVELQEAKITSDEMILKLSRENLELKKRNSEQETLKTYELLGIQTGDRVVQMEGSYVILREVPPTKPPGDNGKQ